MFACVPVNYLKSRQRGAVGLCDAMAETPLFGTTRWTLLESERAAGRGDHWICERYRWPVLVWFRSRFAHHDAEDACQEFFDRVVLRGRLVDRADRTRGSLRGLLRVALLRFAVKYRRRLRRGWQPGEGPMAHDFSPEEGDGELEVCDGESSPEDCFDRIWAADLLDRAIAAVGEHSERKGRAEVFRALRPILDGSGPGKPHTELAAELGMEPRQVTMALFRMRERVGLCLYRLVAETVRGNGSVADEWETVRRLLCR